MLLSHVRSPETQVGLSCLGGQMVYCKFASFICSARLELPIYHLSFHRRNPSGVRFGSSEIYDVLDLCFSNVSSPELFLVDSLAVGQKVDNGADERVVLFVKLLQGQCLSNELQQKIRAEIRTRRSPRHVPARVSFLIQYYMGIIAYSQNHT